jgi:cytochrome c-type biogenesis protein CcmE
MTRRQRRLAAVLTLILGLGAAAALGFTAFRKNMMYFYTPSDLAAQSLSADARVRLGGLLQRGSVKRGEGLRVDFVLADCTHSVPVRYAGILPDLFIEGQGVVTSGRWSGGLFHADEVLAKHDENYMSPELAKSLKQQDGKHACAPFKSVTQS